MTHAFPTIPAADYINDVTEVGYLKLRNVYSLSAG